MLLLQRVKESLRFLKRRRWALFFLNLVAGLFAAPYLYWNSIMMRVVLAAANGTSILIGLNTLNAVTGALLFALAGLGLGGCFSALRRILDGSDGFLPKEILRGIGSCARTSLTAGGVVGVSIAVLRIGVVNLHALVPGGLLRCTLTAFLLLQLVALLPLCLLAVTQEDKLQRQPLQAFLRAGRLFAAQPLRSFLLLAVTILPAMSFFFWRQPVMTLLGFLVVEFCAITPMMLAWQRSALHKTELPARPSPVMLWGLALLICVSAAALLVPLLRYNAGAALQTTLQDTLDFLARQILLDADNGTFRDLLEASAVWPLLLTTLLGSACCILVIFVCACYKFRARALVLLLAVLLQLLPMLARYASIEQLLINMNLKLSSFVICLIWALLYIAVVMLLYRKFSCMRPRLAAARARYPGVRLFFYYAFPQVRLYILALTALVTLGCWDNALAPFWYMRRLGAFSVSSYVWESLSGWAERLGYVGMIVAVFAGFLALLIGASRPGWRSRWGYNRQLRQRGPADPGPRKGE